MEPATASQPIFLYPACNLLMPTKTISAVPSAQTSQAQRRAQPKLLSVLSSVCRSTKRSSALEARHHHLRNVIERNTFSLAGLPRQVTKARFDERQLLGHIKP